MKTNKKKRLDTPKPRMQPSKKPKNPYTLRPENQSHMAGLIFIFMRSTYVKPKQMMYSPL